MYRYRHGRNVLHRHGQRLFQGDRKGRLDPSAPILASLCCLLFVLSGCASLFSGVSGSGNQAKPTVVILQSTPTPTADPPPMPLSNSDLAQKIVQGMSL